MTEIWKETDEFLELIDMKGAMDRAFHRMVAGLFEGLHGTLSEEEINGTVKLYMKAFDRVLPKLLEKSALLYQSEFTAAEIKKLSRQQRDPAAKKLRALQPKLETEMSNYTSDLLKEELMAVTTEEHQARLEKEDEKRQADIAREHDG